MSRTHAPAFEGSITVDPGQVAFDVPVVAVDDTVYAELPLTTGYQDVDPAEYGAPDPAQLIEPRRRLLGTLLAETTDLEEGETTAAAPTTRRSSPITGTVPGERRRRA